MLTDGASWNHFIRTLSRLQINSFWYVYVGNSNPTQRYVKVYIRHLSLFAKKQKTLTYFHMNQ